MRIRHLLACVLVGIVLLSSCSKKKTAPAASTEKNQPTSAAPAQTLNQPPAQPAPVQQNPPQVAQTVPHKTPTPPPKPTVIPSGTVLTVRLQNGVSSKANHQGDRFGANLAEAIVVKGRRVVAAGAPVSGHVAEAKAAGRFKGAATLNLVLDTLDVNGVPYRIHTTGMNQTSKGKGKRTATMVGGAAGAGALIGGLAGGGKGAGIGALAGGALGTTGAGLTGNKNDISLPAEAVVSFQTTAPVTLKPAASTSTETEAKE